MKNFRSLQPNGFTLLELLIVIGALILLVVLGVVLLGTARERERDAKRLSDIDGIRHALDEYFYNNNRYPQAPTPVSLGMPGFRVICAGTSTGFADTRRFLVKHFLRKQPDGTIHEMVKLRDKIGDCCIVKPAQRSKATVRHDCRLTRYHVSRLISCNNKWFV